MTVQKPRRTIKSNGGTLTPFPPGVSGNPSGGKKSQLKLIKEELELKFDFELSTKDVKDLLKLLVFAPKEELEKLKNNPSTPVIILNYITALYSDIKKGQINAARDLIELEFGKAIQKIETKDVSAPMVLSEIEPQKILDTSKYLVAMLDMTLLETFCNWLEEHVDKKRAGEAKIIEG